MRPNIFTIAIVLTASISCTWTQKGGASQTRTLCQLSPRSDIPSANEKSYRNLVADLYAYNLGMDKISRPANLQPDAVLPQLHPWFKAGETFCTQETDDGPILRLATIPQEVVDDINSLSGSEVYGIGLLNGPFWRDIMGIQKELEIGFLMNPGKFEFAGYYSSSEKRIVFDVFANPGTPAHELRHHRQHTSVEEVTKSLLPQSHFSKKCLAATRRFFDELDANAFQMRWWIPTLKFDPKALLSDNGRSALFPHLELLMGFLNYPPLAAAWVEAEACPQSLLNIVGQIKQRTQHFQNQIGHSISQYKTISGIYMMDLAEHLTVDDKKLEASRISIEQTLEFESSARPRDIRSILENLSAPDRAYLATVSGGFKFLIEGKGY